MSVLSFLLAIFESHFNLNVQISSWIVFFIASIFSIKTRNEYRIIELKNGFPLKIDHLILFICAMSIAISFCLMVDIMNYKYTGKFSYFTIGPIIYLLLMFTFASIKMRGYHPN